MSEIKLIGKISFSQACHYYKIKIILTKHITLMSLKSNPNNVREFAVANVSDPSNNSRKMPGQ